MDKFIKILSEQNKTMQLECGHKKCGRKSKVKTIDFFSAKPDYRFVCPYCGETTVYENIASEIEKLKKQFKKSGITW